jgi:hypothetical protein
MAGKVGNSFLVYLNCGDLQLADVFRLLVALELNHVELHLHNLLVHLFQRLILPTTLAR